MTFRSILTPRDKSAETAELPDYFSDLNLDQIVAAITAGADEYNLKPFFRAALKERDDIEYRHEVMQDLEDDAVAGSVKAFSRKMRTMREYVAQSSKMYHKLQKESLYLDSAETYCSTVRALLDDLRACGLRSRGFLAFREYLASYVSSTEFGALAADIDILKRELTSVRYCLLIGDSMLTVTKYDLETDYGAAIQRVFEKFKQGEPVDIASNSVIFRK